MKNNTKCKCNWNNNNKTIQKEKIKALLTLDRNSLAWRRQQRTQPCLQANLDTLMCVSFSISSCWRCPETSHKSPGQDQGNRVLTGGLISSHFPVLLSPRPAPCCSPLPTGSGAPLTGRRVFAGPPRSGISHWCSNACISWGMERSSHSTLIVWW